VYISGGEAHMPELMETCREQPGAGEPGVVIVHGTTSGLVQDVVVGPHHLTADEPAAFGGTASGPSPYDFLLVALGS